MDFPVTGCINGAQKCSNGVVVSCMGIYITFIDYCVMKFCIFQVGGVISDGVGLCIIFFLMVLSCFDSLGGGVEGVLAHSPSEVGMLTPSEGCVNGISAGGVGSTGIIPGVISLMTCWCVRGAKRIGVGSVGVN